MIFEKKIFHVIFYQLNKFHYFLLFAMFGNMWIVIVNFPVCDVISFEITLAFYIKMFSQMTKLVETKI